MDRPSRDALRGRVFAERYRIEQRIGEGATGVVYRASHVRLARAFAIKVLHPQLLANDKVRRRFEREAEIAARLRHDNVIGVVDVGETSEGLRYLVMDFAEGDPLAALIARGPMQPARVRALVRQLCDGLQHAHDAGLIHRDFKPDNVIVQRGSDGSETPRIVDFGIALLRDDEVSPGRERLTTAGIVLGTPHYMAPEHATGKPIDHRIDLFALGIICFEMLTGHLPFPGDGPDVARANMTFDPPRMPDAVDPLMEAFTRKLMARALADRFPSARAARALLDLVDTDRAAAAAALGLPPSRPAPSTTRPAPSTTRPAPSPTRPPQVMQPAAATTDTLETQAMPVLKRRRWFILGALCVFGLGAGLAALRKTPVAIAPHIASYAAAEEPPPAPRVAALPAPRAVALPAPPAPPPPPPPRIATAANPPPPIVAPVPVALPMPMPVPSLELADPAEPTAAEVAELYAVVGRKLSALDRSHGQLATLELWPRYRNLRIQAMLTHPLDRQKAVARLREIEALVDAARGS